MTRIYADVDAFESEADVYCLGGTQGCCIDHSQDDGPCEGF